MAVRIQTCALCNGERCVLVVADPDLWLGSSDTKYDLGYKSKTSKTGMALTLQHIAAQASK